MHEYGLHCYNPTDKGVVLIHMYQKTRKDFPSEKLTLQSKQKLCTPNLYINQLNISNGFFKSKKS